MSDTLVPTGGPAPVKAPTYAELVLTEEHEAEMRERWPDRTESAQRHNMKMSLLAKARHAIKLPDGRRAFGGPQPNSGPKRTRRVGQAVLEAAESRTKEITDAIFAPIAKGSEASPMERHKAGMNIAELARKERDLEMKEDEFALKTGDEIIGDATELVFQLIKGGKIDLDALRAKATSDVDSTADEIDPA